MSIRDALIRIIAQDQTGAGTRSAQASLNSIAAAAERLRNAFGPLTVTAVRFNQVLQALRTGAASFDAFKAAAIDSAEAMGRLAQQTGISAEQMSALAYAAELSDVTVESLSTGLKSLAKQMFEARSGAGEAAALFSALRIDAGAPLQQVLLALAERFAALPDSADKAALAVKFFSRSGLDLIPFLNQGREGIAALMAEAQRFGVVVDTQAAAAADALNDNLFRLQANVRGLTQQFGAQLTPILLDASSALLEAKTQAGGLDEGLRALVTNRQRVLDFAEDVATALAGLADTVRGIGTAFQLGGRAIAVVVKDIETAFRLIAAGATNPLSALLNADEIRQILAERNAFVEEANLDLVEALTAPNLSQSVEQFFDRQRRTVRVLGESFVVETEAAARQVQATYDKFFADPANAAKFARRPAAQFDPAQLKNLESLKSAGQELRKALADALADAAKLRETAAGLFAEADKRRAAGAARAFERSLDGLGDEDKQAALFRRSVELQDQAETTAARARLAAIEGRAKDVETLSAQALRLADEAAAAAERSGSTRRVEEAAEAGAAILEAQARFLEAQAAAMDRKIAQAKDASRGLVLDIDTAPAQTSLQKVLDLLLKIRQSVPPALAAGDAPAVPAKAAGGLMRGPGSDTSDNLLAWLSPGEFVVRAAAVRRYGASFLAALNGMSLPRFAAGGLAAFPGELAGSGQTINLSWPGGGPFEVSASPQIAGQMVSLFQREALKRGRRL